METIQIVLFVLQVLVAVGLILLILIQHGKGADAGAAFGSGASATVFGAQGSGNFLTKMTTGLAFVFLVNSLGLAYVAKVRIEEAKELNLNVDTVVEEQVDPTIPEIPTEIPAEPVVGDEVPTIPEEQ